MTLSRRTLLFIAYCVGLARLGCVAFQYDLVGRADCTQISGAVAHNSGVKRPKMDTRENWGFFSIGLTKSAGRASSRDLNAVATLFHRRRGS